MPEGEVTGLARGPCEPGGTPPPSVDLKAAGSLTLVSVSSCFPGCVFVGAWTHGGWAAPKLGMVGGRGEAGEGPVLSPPGPVLRAQRKH